MFSCLNEIGPSKIYFEVNIPIIEKIKNNSDVVRDINAKSEHIKIVKQGVKMKMSYLL